MLKILCADCLGLSPAILAQFTLKMFSSLWPEIVKNFLKPPYFGGSESFTVIDVDANKKLVTIACYDKQHVSAYL